jgi:hypothetical protein
LGKIDQNDSKKLQDVKDKILVCQKNLEGLLEEKSK